MVVGWWCVWVFAYGVGFGATFVKVARYADRQGEHGVTVLGLGLLSAVFWVPLAAGVAAGALMNAVLEDNREK